VAKPVLEKPFYFLRHILEIELEFGITLRWDQRKFGSW